MNGGAPGQLWLHDPYCKVRCSNLQRTSSEHLRMIIVMFYRRPANWQTRQRIATGAVCLQSSMPKLRVLPTNAEANWQDRGCNVPIECMMVSDFRIEVCSGIAKAECEPYPTLNPPADDVREPSVSSWGKRHLRIQHSTRSKPMRMPYRPGQRFVSLPAYDGTNLHQNNVCACVINSCPGLDYP